MEPEPDVAEGLPLQPLTLLGKLGSKIVGILLPLSWVTGTRYAFSTGTLFLILSFFISLLPISYFSHSED